MIEVPFIQLIKKKSFGPIQLGAPKVYVIETLGEPDGYSNPDFNPEFYDAILYDRYEFNFRKDKLVSITNGYILNWSSNWRFNGKFHYRNDKFTVTSWFKSPWIDTKLEPFKQKLVKEHILYQESIFHDSIKLSIGEDLELLFSSPLSYHKEPEEWTLIKQEELNMRLSHFFLFLPED